ncbi:hypothetical protein J1N35_014435 [Gossypium stocksii]|uniref:Uncharacterized protein n=1 Tax=Gossypium stocksii TaxID=47602 RepID=A0A9D3VX09_9ROSI|nr:hypothetical protein J1N35_014435 [Gossypium stocksii]
MPRHLGFTSVTSTPMTSNATPSMSHSDIEQKMIDTFEMLQQQSQMLEKHQLMLANDLSRAQEEMAIFWGYVRQRDKAIKKALQKNFTKPMPTFPIFPKEFLLEPNDDDEDGEEATAEKNTKKKKTEKIKKLNLYILNLIKTTLM